MVSDQAVLLLYLDLLGTSDIFDHKVVLTQLQTLAEMWLFAMGLFVCLVVCLFKKCPEGRNEYLFICPKELSCRFPSPLFYPSFSMCCETTMGDDEGDDNT